MIASRLPAHHALGAALISGGGMADDLIHCPSCGFQLRLPPELYGQSVECPQCHTRFTAPVPSAAPRMRRPPGREYDATARPAPDDFSSPVALPSSGGALTAPAVCLLVSSLVALIASAYMAFAFFALQNNPAEFDRAIQEAFDKN